MATVVRAMTLGQNYSLIAPSNCVILTSPVSSVSSSSPSPPPMINIMGKRPIAPAISHDQVKNNVIRFNGNDVKNSNLSKSKKMNYSHLTQYTTGPLPSVERRNARERNRVKQVNNGFDKLRQHIPPKIVEIENGGRGASKKLSKVDTLRLAVKYIQGLKQLLDENNNNLHRSETASTISSSSVVSSVSTASSSLSYYSPSPLSSGQAQSFQHHSYQDNHRIQTCSEPSVSPTPSYNSDVSTNQQIYHLSATASATPYHPDENVYPTNYGFADDSGNFEEEGILDDILHWQLQN